MEVVIIEGKKKVGVFTYHIPSDLCPNEYGLNAVGSIYKADDGGQICIAPLRVRLCNTDMIKTKYGVIIPERFVTQKSLFNEIKTNEITELPK